MGSGGVGQRQDAVDDRVQVAAESGVERRGTSGLQRLPPDRVQAEGRERAGRAERAQQRHPEVGRREPRHGADEHQPAVRREHAQEVGEVLTADDVDDHEPLPA